MDRPYAINFLVLRPWLMAAALTSLALLTAMVVINRLNRKGYLSLLRMLKCGDVVCDLAIGKVLIWSVV